MRHLTYANVMATLALFAALGGGAYAIDRTPDLAGRFHACVTKRTGAIRVVASSASCRRRGLRAELAVAWSQTGPAGPAGQNGRDGFDGRNGLDGHPGANAATSVVVRKAATATPTADCQPGERAVGGGGDTGGSNGALEKSVPTPASGTPTGWAVSATGMFNPTAYVICAAP
jgi:hypothetical protein